MDDPVEAETATGAAEDDPNADPEATDTVEVDPNTDPAETAGVETKDFLEESSFSSSPKLSLIAAGDCCPPESAFEEATGASTGEAEGLAKIPSENAF